MTFRNISSVEIGWNIVGLVTFVVILINLIDKSADYRIVVKRNHSDDMLRQSAFDALRSAIARLLFVVCLMVVSIASASVPPRPDTENAWIVTLNALAISVALIILLVDSAWDKISRVGAYKMYMRSPMSAEEEALREKLRLRRAGDPPLDTIIEQRKNNG